jgi:hypothetical protein
MTKQNVEIERDIRPDFAVGVPSDEDFVVRFRGRGARPIEVTCLRSANGGVMAFAHRSVEIELIGTQVARGARSAAAAKRRNSKSLTRKQAARGRQTR